MTKNDSNIVKGIAVIMLLVHHLFNKKSFFLQYEIFPKGGVEQETLISVSVFCKVCVAIFVFISAYGLTKQYMVKSVMRSGKLVFLDAVNRYVKLIINLWCIFIPALIFSVILQKHTFWSVYGSDNSIGSAITYFLTDMLGLSKLFEFPSFNSTWWYVSFAILLFITVPLLYFLTEKVGGLVIPLSIFMVTMVSADHSLLNYFFRYLIGIFAAILFARYDVIEKFTDTINGKVGRKLSVAIILLLALGLCYYIRTQSPNNSKYIDNIFAIALVLLVSTICTLKVFQFPLKWLGFIGKYSMNIFLVHTFIKNYFWGDFIYSLHYWWLILIVLLVISLLTSVSIEKLKVICRVNSLQKVIEMKLKKISA